MLTQPIAVAPMRPDLSISRARLALLLGGLAMFGPFSIDTIFPAFGAIGADLQANAWLMQQTISAYLIAYAGASLFHGALSDAFGRRKVILFGLAVFTAASVGCALARSIEMLLALRALQGLSAGVGLIVGRAVIRDCLHGHEAQKMMSNVSMIFGIAPALAPIVGGWLLDWTGWHSIFWFLVLFACVLWTTTALALPETHPPENRTSFRPALMLRTYRTMFGNPVFVKLAVAGSLNFNALFVYISSAPVFVQGLMGLNERQYAWFFAPTIGGMTLGAFVAGRMAGRVDGLRMANIGCAIGAGAAVVNLVFNFLATSLHPLAFHTFGVPLLLPLAVLPIVATAFGVSLVFPVLTLAVLDIYPKQRGAAASAQAFIGLVIASLVAGVVSPLVSHNGQHLAATAAICTATAWLLWNGYARGRKRALRMSADDAATALEPSDAL